jgi:hypothetical protein
MKAPVENDQQARRDGVIVSVEGVKRGSDESVT